MAELLPTLQARAIRESIADYLATTFALTDPGARVSLEEFLKDRERGLFKGPFLRLRMPFSAAEAGWEDTLDLSPEFPPYGHQARAFARLTTKPIGSGSDDGANDFDANDTGASQWRTPQPTLVVTGTGSGKTEAFLYPILDHVRRVRLSQESGSETGDRAGNAAAHATGNGRGIKALILYPMNALANDQAKRIVEMVANTPALKGTTVGLYTGQGAGAAQSIAAGTTAGGLLMTDRHDLRKNLPDILLTNYKMLDQLLLRPEDQVLWKESADSLQYLVLDEFHTYDGAQGTDVAMLLRRLGLALKSYSTDTLVGPDGIDASDNSDGSGNADSPFKDSPLGKVVPVATSATLGDKGDPSRMLSFARTVFGVEFDETSVVTESRTALSEWHTPGSVTLSDGHTATAVPVSELDQWALFDDLHEYSRQAASNTDSSSASENSDSSTTSTDSYTRELAARVLSHLFTLSGPTGTLERDDAARALASASAPQLLALEKASSIVANLAERSEAAASLEDLADILPRPRPRGVEAATRRTRDQIYLADPRTDILEYVIGALSYIRANAGRGALTVEVHMWVRELSRIERMVAIRPAFRWFDDGTLQAPEDDTEPGYSLPAIYCRHCGRSGWMASLAPTGTDLDAADEKIRERYAQRDNRIRALMYAQREADLAADLAEADSGEEVTNLHWFHTDVRRISAQVPDPDDPKLSEGIILPVLAFMGNDASEKAVDYTCPNCDRKDGIRPLGSRIATLLSVTLSTMFGDQYIDALEKKALIFTDSVQDAAHRAGFVQARSHALTLRAALNQAITPSAQTLEELVDRVLSQAEDSAHERYRLVPPDCTERAAYERYWNVAQGKSVPSGARATVRKRLIFDASLEFGLQHTLGRTLELTATAQAHVRVPAGVSLVEIGRVALEGYGQVQTLSESSASSADSTAAFSDEQILRWITGILERMRSEGAIWHDWLSKYIASDGMRIWIWGKRNKQQGMPAFPRGRSGFGFPRAGSPIAGETDFVSINAAQGWYGIWTSRALKLAGANAGNLAAKLFKLLAQHDVVQSWATDSGGTVYGLRPEQIIISSITGAALTGEPRFAQCEVCSTLIPGTAEVVSVLAGGPCFLVRCTGTLAASAGKDNFYRNLYQSADMRRIIAREHSSMLDDATRLKYENGFKASSSRVGDPNVLVATPTLEMGIDIGDLSAVMLASMPRTVASYIQRVGRAGRQTGNALDLAYVRGRGNDLAKLEDPLSVINGSVRAPATYLGAEEILRRQYLASVIDQIARQGTLDIPNLAETVFGSSASGRSFLTSVVRYAENNASQLIEQFLGQFDAESIPHFEQAAEELTAWATPAPDGSAQAGAGEGEETALRGGLSQIRTQPGAGEGEGTAIVGGTSDLARDVYGGAARWKARKDAIKHRLDAIAEVKPEIEYRSTLLNASEDDVAAHRSLIGEQMLLIRQREDMRTQYWIAALEEYGLLPNYTLIDDSVDLDITIRWRDENDGYQSDELTLTRGASRAIREFVPGAHFYARGYHTEIQAIDLGSNSSEVHEHAFCDKCGYSEQILEGVAKSHTCPRCGSSGIGDTGQILKTIELKRVSAEISRDEALISDSTDDREQPFFTVRTLADINASAENLVTQWYITDHEFGVRYLRRITLTELNLGRSGQNSPEMALGGNTERTPLFSVCSYCGKLDRSANRNSPRDHRAWCIHRTAHEEHNTTLAITRTLNTQGIVLRLPHEYTHAEDTAVPSLTAAILLGLREHIGGEPDHLGVIETVDPHYTDGSTNRRALLVHDLVPGGTGYLADLANPVVLRSILLKAYDVLVGCSCDPNQLMACANCLLPYTTPAFAPRTSRVTALRLLQDLLNSTTAQTSDEQPDPSAQWQVTKDITINTTLESHLEGQFRKKLSDMITGRGGTISESHTPGGTQLNISLPGASVTWKLKPQVNLGFTQPDFVLESNNPNIKKIAIYTDGYAFHATSSHNNLADDAAKRNSLRALGFLVLSVTSSDLADKPMPYLPAWYDETRFSLLSSRTGAESHDYNVFNGGVLEMIWHYIEKAQAKTLSGAGATVPLLLMLESRQYAEAGLAVPSVEHLAAFAKAHENIQLTKETFEAALAEVQFGAGNDTLIAFQEQGNLYLAAITLDGLKPLNKVLLVHDDTPGGLAQTGHREAWEAWLRAANMLTWGDFNDVEFQFATATTVQDAGSAGAASGFAGAVGSGMPGSPVEQHWDAGTTGKGTEGSPVETHWDLSSTDYEPEERKVLLELWEIVGNKAGLAQAVHAEFELGAEEDGTPISLAWPSLRIGYLIDAQPGDIGALQAAGWTVYCGQIDELAGALENALAN
ncbi:DEAD/DEAH box helicase [Populibacterium corticicola]|uniref:DEAD/DEAH box helicase n=1 Tax=Populibacterium corticicola TaxID=1812826 RepID=A0ABW5XCX5_9MICO